MHVERNLYASTCVVKAQGFVFSRRIMLFLRVVYKWMREHFDYMYFAWTSKWKAESRYSVVVVEVRITTQMWSYCKLVYVGCIV